MKREWKSEFLRRASRRLGTVGKWWVRGKGPCFPPPHENNIPPILIRALAHILCAFLSFPAPFCSPLYSIIHPFPLIPSPSHWANARNPKCPPQQDFTAWPFVFCGRVSSHTLKSLWPSLCRVLWPELWDSQTRPVSVLWTPSAGRTCPCCLAERKTNIAQQEAPSFCMSGGVYAFGPGLAVWPGWRGQ